MADDGHVTAEARRAVVVGATGGIGGSVARRLLDGGYHVVATGRDDRALAGLAKAGASVAVLDLAQPHPGRRVAAEAARTLGDGLDVLVVATGTLGPIGPTRRVDLVALEHCLKVNLVAVLDLVQGTADMLDRGVDPSIVLFSGGGATGVFPRYTAYALAKVGIVRLVENLAAEEPGWRVNAVAPGFVATSIHDATLAEDPERVGAYQEVTRRRLEDAVPPSVAAELVAYLAAPGAKVTGRLLSAVWDRWREPSFAETLRSDDSFGRLRRIDGTQFVTRPPRPHSS